MNLSEPFIRRPVMTAVLTLSAILFGTLAYRSLPVNDLPAVDYPVIQVQVNYPGATPETMANNVATPLERQFMQIPGLELVTSNSGQGHTSFVLQFALSKVSMPRLPTYRRRSRGHRGNFRSICLVHPRSQRRTPTISRSCISGSPAIPSPRVNFTIMRIPRLVNASAFCLE